MKNSGGKTYKYALLTSKKALEHNINGKFYDLIKNMYSKTAFFIKLGTKRTKTFIPVY